MKRDSRLNITVKTFFGFEETLKQELQEFGYSDIEVRNRAVSFKGDWHDVYFLNVHVRTGISVLVELKSFQINNEKDLYRECAKIDWTRYFGVDDTFAIKGAVFSDLFRHSQYPFLVVKDAIVDTFRKRSKLRPSVEIRSPKVLFDLYINNKDVVLSINTSGAPLFQRGYRQSVGPAPLNEVVAAGLIKMTGWDGKTPLYDPFCGSGTILAEAAMISVNLPPAVERTSYAFMNLRNYDQDDYQEIMAKVDRRINKLPIEIGGSDISPEMIAKTRRNLRHFSFGRHVNLNECSFEEVKKPAEKGIIITNPPYGERIGDHIESMYEGIGDWLKQEMDGWECWILSSNIDALKSVGLHATEKHKVFNGSLECSFRKFELYKGSLK